MSKMTLKKPLPLQATKAARALAFVQPVGQITRLNATMKLKLHTALKARAAIEHTTIGGADRGVDHRVGKVRWIVAIASSMFLLPAVGADIYAEKRHQVHIDGEIRTGDAERVASLISTMPIVGTFYVKSLGGNVDEALKIATLIEGTHATFTIKKGELCASACFFMFIAGKYKFASAFTGEDGQNPSAERRAQGFRYVGIHRPYLTSKEEVTGASENKQERLMQAVRGYLQKKQVPQYLVDEMMGRASNQIYWLRDKDLDLLGDYPPGYEEVLIKECGYNKVARLESWTSNRVRQFDECQFDVWEREYVPAQRRYIKRLATGWRPWGKQ